jgi:hypothetical protein
VGRPYFYINPSTMINATEENDSLVDEVEQFVKTKTELYTLKVTAKVADIISSLLSRLVILMLVLIVLFMLSMALALWIGDLVGQPYAGYLIVAGSGAVLTLLLYFFRYRLLRKPVMNSIIEQALKDHHHV